MERTIRHRWFFAHAPEIIWDYLTQPGLLAEWFMDNDFKPVVGHQFRFTTEPKFKLGFDGIVYCEVLEVMPRERLSYSWKGGPGKGKITLDSVVTWVLVPKEGGTEVHLEHRGFKGVKNYLSYLIMNKGWKVGVPKKLLRVLNQQHYGTGI